MVSSRAAIVGWGMRLPARVVTNADLAECLDTSDEWIASRTGIRERRIAAEGETTATLAIDASKAALTVAGIEPAAVDLVLVATSTPDHLAFPSTASLVQVGIGATNAAAMDIGAACTGFVYALATADSFIRSRNARTVLVVGSETMSRILNWEDRSTCVLFGDGAGAVVMTESSNESGILAVTLGADGLGAEMLIVPAGGSRLPFSQETLVKRQNYVQMDGRNVFRFSVKILPEMIKKVLDSAGLDQEDIALIVPHQANSRIVATAAKALGVPMEKFFLNMHAYGNTSAASIPIALVEALQAGLIQSGDVVVLAGFGGGLTWGAAAIRWGNCADTDSTRATSSRQQPIR